MEKLSVILSRKQSSFHHISSSCAVSDAISKMRCQNIDYLVVMDDNNQFAGLISDHEITEKAMMANMPLSKTMVCDVMNNSLPHADATDTIECCMKMMQRHHTRFVPVFEDFNFIGVISSEDILQEAVYNRLEIFDV